MAASVICQVEVCDRPVLSRGYCNAHYKRMQKISSGAYVAAGMDDPVKDYRPGGWSEWIVSVKGYVYRYKNVGGKTVQELQHRFVMSEMLGRELLAEESVHHKNGDRSDNRAENLELWSKSQPYGQRAEDKADWAIEILKLYRPEALIGGEN